MLNQLRIFVNFLERKGIKTINAFFNEEEAKRSFQRIEEPS